MPGPILSPGGCCADAGRKPTGGAVHRLGTAHATDGHRLLSVCAFCIETMLNETSKSYSTVAVICEDFCADESHICVRYCCPRGEVEEPNGKCLPHLSLEDIKPKALIEAEKKGIGKALYNYVPYCSESDRVHLNTSEVGLPIGILENGSLDLGQ